MEKTLPGIAHTLYLTERVNGIYEREDAFIPEVHPILAPGISLVHKKPVTAEWEPPPSGSHRSGRGPLQSLLTFPESPWL